jgi:hypothetical protein
MMNPSSRRGEKARPGGSFARASLRLETAVPGSNDQTRLQCAPPFVCLGEKGEQPNHGGFAERSDAIKTINFKKI